MENKSAFDAIVASTNPHPTDLTLMLNIFRDNTQMNLLLRKLNYTLDDKAYQQLNKVIGFLTENNIKFGGVPPLQNMITSIKDVFEDGKLTPYEVPILVGAITELLNLRLPDIKGVVDLDTVVIIIKLIIHILIMQKIIKISNMDEETIYAMVDSSILLLKTTINISKVSCSCFPCFNK
jgi:hypothetical protein